MSTMAMGVLLSVTLLLSLGVTTWAIASDTPVKNTPHNSVSLKEENAGDDTTIQARSDYPDFEDLSSFFDFELGPPNEEDNEYQKLSEMHGSSKIPASPRPHRNNKNYYYYKSGGSTSYYGGRYHPSPTKKQVVTPGTHYKKPFEKFTDTEAVKGNESQPTVNQAIVGPYQVSVVDAKSPLLSNLGLSQDDLEKLSGYNRRSTTNATMYGSDSIQSATYAENPHPDYKQPSYAPPPSSHGPAPYEQKHSYHENHNDRQYKPNDYYPAENPPPYRNYNSAPPPAQPPAQGSYDAKSYRAVQNSAPPNPSNYNYPPPSYNNPAPYNNPPPAYNNPPSSNSYSPQRSSGEPWRHTDWDDNKSKNKDSWQESGPYPPHPAPLSYTNQQSHSGSYYPRHTYASSNDKTGQRLAATYIKPETPAKQVYSASSSGSSDYHAHKPSYYPSSSYSPASKAPARAGSVSYGGSSSHHHHQPPPGKPGITIRFKAKTPGHSGLSIPLNFSPLEVVKKLLPLSALNPLNNKKVTIGITIENKKENHQDYHPY